MELPASEVTIKKKIYFENLDALRFICFLTVFLYHSFYTEKIEILNNSTYHFIKKKIFYNGDLGVNFFFVLSGFLITYLLIQEKIIRVGAIAITDFWKRRILRIWPLYYLCVFFGFIIFPWLKTTFGGTPNETANPIAYLFFLNNLDVIKSGLPDASILGVLWSIAIEEQFYLIWPIILYIFPIKKFWIPFSVIILVSLLFRAYHNSLLINNFHTLSCISDMATGGLGAWLICVSNKFRSYIESMKKPYILIIYILFFVVFFFRAPLFFGNYYPRIIERLLISILMIHIILEQCFATNSFFKLKRLKLFSYLGTISYGLYCLHFLGILIAITLLKKVGLDQTLFHIVIIQTILAFVFTIIISMISYRVLEKPFLRLKNKLSIIETQKENN